MLKTKIFILMLWVAFGGVTTIFAQQGDKPSLQNSCISCHLEMGDELAVPVEGLKNDVHAEVGLSCADCHGGDPTVGFDGDMEASMDPAKGYIGAPKRPDIPKFCARCHSDPNYMRRFNPRLQTDQYERYQTSVHGKRLRKGDTKVATCVDCHSVHGIRKPNDSRSSVYPLNVPETCGKCHANAEYMKPYNIPTDQVEEYKQSVHGIDLLQKGDLAAPACNDCHGNHGASPPGAPSIAFICGQCHLNNSELFLKSPHRQAFAEQDIPECEACHGNHKILHPSDDLLGVGAQSICVDCHDEGSKGYKAAVAMHNDIRALKAKISFADSLVQKAERAGMQITEAQFQLKDANDALIKSRTMVHSFSVDKEKESTVAGLKSVNEAIVGGEKALKDLQFRRKGLAVSIVFIAILALGLYLKIKELDKKHPSRTLS